MPLITPHLLSLSNWSRYAERYDPDTIALENLESRITDIEDDMVRNRLKEYINIQLGILLLAHHEVDSQKRHDILSMFR